MAFLHYHLDTDKTTKLCCHSTETLSNTVEPYNSEKFVNVRQKMIDGKPVAGCERCYQSEANGIESIRLRTIEDLKQNGKLKLYAQQIKDFKSGKKLDPYWYDLRLSNFCQLACEMCGPKYSSTWAKNLKINDQNLQHEPEIDMNSLVFRVQLSGGEPMLIKRYVDLLNQIKNEDCEIIVNTNLQHINLRLVSALERFKPNVTFIASIDAYGELNDQIRIGSSWHRTHANLGHLQVMNFNVAVNTVVQRSNVVHLKPLADYFTSMEIEDWLLSELYEPEHMKWIHQPVTKLGLDGLKAIVEMGIVKRNKSSITLLEHIISTYEGDQHV